jgi:hypothetical protein
MMNLTWYLDIRLLRVREPQSVDPISIAVLHFLYFTPYRYMDFLVLINSLATEDSFTGIFCLYNWLELTS